MGIDSSAEQGLTCVPFCRHYSDPSHTTHTFTDYDEYDPDLPEVEQVVIPLPSSYTLDDCTKFGLVAARTTEAKLRRGLISDTLLELRLTLGQRLMRFRELRDEASQSERKAAQSRLNTLKRNIRELRDRYRDQVSALQRLSPDPSSISQEYPDISDDDLYLRERDGKPDLDYYKRSRKLPWFWTGSDVSIGVEVHELPIMAKCPWFSLLYCYRSDIDRKPVYQVNYLRAQANATRFNEDILFLGKEMEWRVNWFYYQSHTWWSRAANHIFQAGPHAFAVAQAARWIQMGQKSLDQFRQYLKPLVYHNLKVMLSRAAIP
jgi:hypothetical protein